MNNHIGYKSYELDILQENILLLDQNNDKRYIDTRVSGKLEYDFYHSPATCYDYFPYNNVMCKIEVKGKIQEGVGPGRFLTDDYRIVELLHGSLVIDDVKYEYQHGLLMSPNDDTPALEMPDGTKYWFLDGMFHRENGPALIEPNVSIWYYNGLKHCLDGPSVVYVDGLTLWYYNGEIHRDAGPAVILPDGGRVWFQFNLFHREGLPALVITDDLKKFLLLYSFDCVPIDFYPTGTQCWFNNGRLHNDNGWAVEFPAIPNCPVISREWWVHGMRHRTDGPAIINSSGTQTWYKNNLIHRDDDNPAIISTMGKGVIIKKWYRNGFLHRDDDKPAVLMHPSYSKWYKHGKLHRIGMPAVIIGDTNEWWVNGMHHREEGPAVTSESRNTKEWWYYGRRHRVGGPAYCISEDGKVFAEEWYQNGILHRTDGPAYFYDTQLISDYVHGSNKIVYHVDGVEICKDIPLFDYMDGFKSCFIL